MDKVIVTKSKLTSIADAIRSKTGKADTMTLADMPTEIAGISGGDEGNAIANSMITKSITNYADDTLTYIGEYAFSNSSNLESIYTPNVETLSLYAFNMCDKLSSISFPKVTSIGERGFYGCNSLTEIDFPVLTSIGIHCFSRMTKLSSVNLPMLESIGNYGFYVTTSLTFVDLPSLKFLSVNGFTSSGVNTLILRSETLCTLQNSNAFNSTSISKGTGYIYVPSALVDDYKNATNWSTYASQIRAIEDYPEICGG